MADKPQSFNYQRWKVSLLGNKLTVEKNGITKSYSLNQPTGPLEQCQDMPMYFEVPYKGGRYLFMMRSNILEGNKWKDEDIFPDSFSKDYFNKYQW